MISTPCESHDFVVFLRSFMASLISVEKSLQLLEYLIQIAGEIPTPTKMKLSKLLPVVLTQR